MAYKLSSIELCVNIKFTDDWTKLLIFRLVIINCVTEEYHCGLFELMQRETYKKANHFSFENFENIFFYIPMWKIDPLRL